MSEQARRRPDEEVPNKAAPAEGAQTAAAPAKAAAWPAPVEESAAPAARTAAREAARDAADAAKAAAAEAEALRIALGWAPAPRGPAGRLLEAAGSRSRRLWRAAGRRIVAGGAAFRRMGLARLAALGHAEPERALRLVRRLPPGRFRAEAEALLVARSRGWQEAAPLFERLAASRGAGTASDLPGRGPGTALLRPRPPVPALVLATPVAQRPAAIPPDLARRLVVYTACFGRAPDLPPLTATDGIRYLCFTDAETASPGWEVLPGVPDAADPGDAGPDAAGPDAAASAAALEAAHKIRAHAVLTAAAPEAEWSLFLAPRTRLAGNLHTLVTRWLGPHDLAMWRHPRAIDWHDLAEHGLLAGEAPGAILAQARAAEAAGCPRDRGAVDTALLWRRHGAPRVRALMEAWWRLEAGAPGADAISLYRALSASEDEAGAETAGRGSATAPARPAILPEALGPAGDSLFAAHDPRAAPVRPQAPAARIPPAHPPEAQISEARIPAAPPRAARRIPVAFLYAEAHAKTATTFLRGEQLSAMVARAFPDRLDVLYTHDPDAVRDRVVILTKSALQTREPAAIEALRARNILAIGSWDDIMPRPAHVAALDAHMTLSIRQTLALNRLYPQTPAFLVTHHVNPQVAAGTPPGDRLRTAYFGDLRNTARPESIAPLVDLVGINTARVNDSWLDALPRYNCHWIVRRPQPWNGWKPFLKAFVAARRGAAVIVTRDDGDALYYLGDDYPFYADSLEPADLEMAMARVAGSFGGPDWTRALEIMAQVGARSSDAQVCAEFRAMVETLAA